VSAARFLYIGEIIFQQQKVARKISKDEEQKIGGVWDGGSRGTNELQRATGVVEGGGFGGLVSR